MDYKNKYLKYKKKYLILKNSKIKGGNSELLKDKFYELSYGESCIEGNCKNGIGKKVYKTKYDVKNKSYLSNSSSSIGFVIFDLERPMVFEPISLMGTPANFRPGVAIEPLITQAFIPIIENEPITLNW